MRGQATLDRPGGERLRLKAGDILLLTNGDAHTVRAPGPPARPASPVATRRHGALRVRTSIGVEPDVEVVCGRLRFEAAPRNLIVAALPDVVVLRVGEQPLAARLHPLLVGIREELNDGRAGAFAIAEDLASALFVMMLRAHLEASAPTQGLLRLLERRIAARAVLAMIRDPGRAWALDELARASAASRATLVRAFRKAAGVAPLKFLTDLRLGLARHRLRSDDGVSLDQVAAEVGFRSQGAFSRAFLRGYGVRPGRARQDAHAPEWV